MRSKIAGIACVALLLAAIAGVFFAGARLRQSRGESPVPEIRTSTSQFPLETLLRASEKSQEEVGIDVWHEAAVLSVDFSADGKRIGSGSRDGKIILWDAESGRARSVLTGHTDAVQALRFSPAGDLLASAGADESVRLWSSQDGSALRTLAGHDGRIRALAFAADGRRLASGSDDRTVRLWDVTTGEQVALLDGHPRAVTALAFSADGKRLYAGLAVSKEGKKEALWEWDLEANRSERRLRRNDSSFGTPDMRPLAVLTGDVLALGTGADVLLADARRGTEIRTVKTGTTMPLFALATRADGKQVATGGMDVDAYIWDPDTGKPLHELRGHLLHVTSLAFSPDGRILATGSADRTVRLWNTESGKAIRRLGRPLGDAEDVWSLQVTSSRTSDKFEVWPNSWTTKDGGRFVLVDVSIENLLPEANMLWMSAFVLRNERETRVVQALGGHGILESPNVGFFIEPREKGKYTLVFIVPKGETGFQLRFLGYPPIHVSAL